MYFCLCLINFWKHSFHITGCIEYITGSELISMVKEVLGTIDLDPFSSKVGNMFVNALKFFTPSEDGFKQQWCGNCWISGPRKFQDKIIKKLLNEVQLGNCKSFIILTRLNNLSKNFYLLLRRYFMCVVEGK